MNIPIYHVDAFAKVLFSGNPAAVCVLEKWLEDDLLCAIARENNLPATVFLVKEQDIFKIRWITPEYELSLCGHGTLAAAFVIFHYIEPTRNKITLQSRIEKLEV